MVKTDIMNTEKLMDSMVGMPELLLKKVNRKYQHKVKIDSPISATKLLKTVAGDYCNYKEMMIAIYFDYSNKAIGHSIVGIGNVNSCVVDIQDVCRISLLSGAQNVIVGHNHPSGELKPSSKDLEITRKLKKALKYLDIKLLDHIIFRDEDYSYFSFQNEGEI